MEESKEIAGGKLGDVGAYDIKWENNQLVANISVHAGNILFAGLVVKLDGNEIITAIEKAIPGQIDDVILEGLRKALTK